MNLLITVCLIFSLAQNSWQGEVFYNAIATDNINAIEKAISYLENKEQTNINSAYLGALYIKKSSFEKTHRSKTFFFNKGKNLIENAIKSSPENIEMRFIRLMMQENSPRILKYNTNLENDKQIIIQNFLSLDKVLQTIVLDYAETSHVLDLK